MRSGFAAIAPSEWVWEGNFSLAPNPCSRFRIKRLGTTSLLPSVLPPAHRKSPFISQLLNPAFQRCLFPALRVVNFASLISSPTVLWKPRLIPTTKRQLPNHALGLTAMIYSPTESVLSLSKDRMNSFVPMFTSTPGMSNSERLATLWDFHIRSFNYIPKDLLPGQSPLRCWRS